MVPPRVVPGECAAYEVARPVSPEVSVPPDRVVVDVTATVVTVVTGAVVPDVTGTAVPVVAGTVVAVVKGTVVCVVSGTEVTVIYLGIDFVSVEVPSRTVRLTAKVPARL